MKILVTGGTGLVGSRVLQRFQKEGIACRALVREGRNVDSGAEIVTGDLLTPESLPAALEGISAVVHLAAVFRTTNDDAIWKANLEGTRNLVAAVKQRALEARFVMASTTLVYSNETTRPGLESDVVEPKLAYPASKVAAEHELRQSGLNSCVLRLAFVYGDGDGHLESIPKLVPAQKLHPAQTFSMIHQRDVAQAIKLALAGRFDGEIVNVVDDAPTSVFEMAQIVNTTLDGSNAPLENPWMGRADGTKIRSLGFKPTIPTIYQAAEQGLL